MSSKHKRRVRARMQATGESYTAAKRGVEGAVEDLTRSLLPKIHGMRPLARELNEATDRLNEGFAQLEVRMRANDPGEREIDLGAHVLAWRAGTFFVDRYSPEGEYIQTIPLRSATRAERCQAAGIGDLEPFRGWRPSTGTGTLYEQGASRVAVYASGVNADEWTVYMRRGRPGGGSSRCPVCGVATWPGSLNAGESGSGAISRGGWPRSSGSAMRTTRSSRAETPRR